MLKIINTIIKIDIKFYITTTGKKPFIVWLESLTNVVNYRVREKLDRIALGNFGDHKYISDGVNEFRLNFGSGYRIYFGFASKESIVLLNGGDKSKQKIDIIKALNYWQDYLKR